MPTRWMMVSGDEPLQKVEFEIDSPKAGEVVVEIAGCGVCHTDLGYYYDGVRTNQPLPLCLGHEISGTVVQAGEGAEDWMGRKVIVPAANATCASAARAPSAATRRCPATTSRADSPATSRFRRAGCARWTWIA